MKMSIFVIAMLQMSTAGAALSQTFQSVQVPTDLATLAIYAKCAAANHVDAKTFAGNVVIAACLEKSIDIIDADHLIAFLSSHNDAKEPLTVQPSLKVIGFPPQTTTGVAYTDAPERVVYLCSEAYFEEQTFKAETAIEISDWSMSLVVRSAGETASECFDKYHHPFYAVEKAYFYLQAARLLVRETPPDVRGASILGTAATVALEAASSFALHGALLNQFNDVQQLDKTTINEVEAVADGQRPRAEKAPDHNAGVNYLRFLF